MYRPAKVRNLYIAAQIEQEIFRFDISMNDILPVTVIQRVGHLIDVLRVKNPILNDKGTTNWSTYQCGTDFGKASCLLQRFEHFTMRRILEHQINASIIIKVVEKAQYIRMTAKTNTNYRLKHNCQLTAYASVFQLRVVADAQHQL